VFTAALRFLVTIKTKDVFANGCHIVFQGGVEGDEKQKESRKYVAFKENVG
jgi:hypothetical protein